MRLSTITSREAAVAATHRRRFGHCSAERIASGIGLIATDETLDGLDACPALAETASNLAMTLGALGGVYLASGILQGLEGLFDEAAFRASFIDKDRFRPYLQNIPTDRVHAAVQALRGLATTVGQASARLPGWMWSQPR